MTVVDASSSGVRSKLFDKFSLFKGVRSLCPQVTPHALIHAHTPIHDMHDPFASCFGVVLHRRYATTTTTARSWGTAHLARVSRSQVAP